MIEADVRTEPKVFVFTCAIKKEKETDYRCFYGIDTKPTGEIYRIPIAKCLFIQTLMEAFEKREYDKIHEYSKKMSNHREWQSLVVQTTGIDWNRWSMHIGTWLMRECRINPTAPFKALLPESDTKESKDY
jgi:hypothetical protein